MKSMVLVFALSMMPLGMGCGGGALEGDVVHDPCTGQTVGSLLNEETVQLHDGTLRSLSEVWAVHDCEAVGSQEQAMTRSELNELIKELKPPPSK